MPKVGQFDPRHERRGAGIGDITPEMAEAFYEAAQDKFSRIQAVVLESSPYSPLPPYIPIAIAQIAVTGYNEY